jgi:hypothetical protein
MKRIALYLATLTMVGLACALPAPKTPPAATNTDAHTAAPPPAPAATHTATAAVTPSPQANVVCNEISFFLDPALASGSHCETIPEASGEDLPLFGINPQTTQVTLDGYILADRFHTPRIQVFPVARFQELAPEQVNPRLARLQELISGAAPGKETLPLLPVFNAAQMFKAQYSVVPFQNGKGIRYITMYGQAYYPVNNHDMFLSYQGLTADGKRWVSIVLPISHPSLPATGDPASGDMNNAEAYFAQKAADLNGQPAGSFSPSLPALDALLQSIQIQP